MPSSSRSTGSSPPGTGRSTRPSTGHRRRGRGHRRRTRSSRTIGNSRPSCSRRRTGWSGPPPRPGSPRGAAPRRRPAGWRPGHREVLLANLGRVGGPGCTKAVDRERPVVFVAALPDQRRDRVWIATRTVDAGDELPVADVRDADRRIDLRRGLRRQDRRPPEVGGEDPERHLPATGLRDGVGALGEYFLPRGNVVPGDDVLTPRGQVERVVDRRPPVELLVLGARELDRERLRLTRLSIRR